MITFHFHLQPQYKYELFHIYFTKITQSRPQVFFSQWFNNLQRAALLTSLIQNDMILLKSDEQQLVMVNYTCGFNQPETRKYFE